MATAKDNVSIPATIANTPVNVDKHREDMERRRKEQEKRRPKLMRCLDPVTAAQYEARKPVYEWQIECELFRAATKKNRAGFEKFSEQVVAQNEDDAWAMFCDKIGRWPNRGATKLTITKLEKRTLRDDD